MSNKAFQQTNSLRRRLLLGTASLPFMGLASQLAHAQAHGVVWTPPKKARFGFDMVGIWKGPVSGSGRLDWDYDAANRQYELGLDISALFLSFFYSSKGLYTKAAGFMPAVYQEKRIGRDRSVFFDYPNKKLRFSWKDEKEARVLEQGMQDTTSVMMQIASLIANNPKNAQVGQRFIFPMARMGTVKQWDFTIVSQDEIQSKVGRYLTWHVNRVFAEGDDDLQVEFWIAPQLNYMPVQMSFNRKNGTYLKVTINKINELVV